MPLNLLMCSYCNKKNNIRYLTFLLFRAYNSNQIALFFQKRFQLFNHNLRSSIIIANIAYIIFIIFLEKREKKCIVCGFREML